MEVRLRATRPADIGFVTALERHADNREFIGQWSDAEHFSAIAGERGREHWIVECDAAPAGYLIAYDCRAADAGCYVKRLLVADKGRGIGTAALREYCRRAFGRESVSSVWLIVLASNARAQRVYRNLGFERYDPSPEDEKRYDAAAEPPIAGAFRMRLAGRLLA